MTERISTLPDVPPELIARLERTLGNLRMLPAAASQALQIANDPDCDFLRLAGVIQRDLKLTTHVLRTANSALFAPRAPVASLHHAISSMGLRRCREVILTAGLDSVSRKISPRLCERRETLWRHGFLTSIFAVKISHLLRLGFQGEEFTAGLMHDFGRTLLAVAAPDEIDELDPLDFDEPLQIEIRERERIGVSHAAFGAWYAEINELPAALVHAIRHHHAPASAGEHVRLAALIAAADHVANHVQRGTDEPYNPMLNGALVVLQQDGVTNATGVFSDAIDAYVREAPAVAEELMQE
ncbi:MAG: HDOD domain-containing protein [Planctomyces sp.]|nr:HDOD domain-containing protein [Planctomyces sp.]